MNWMKLAVAGGWLAACAAGAAENPLPSPGFEGDNAKWWAIGDVDFLVAQQAAFMTPAELVARKQSGFNIPSATGR